MIAARVPVSTYRLQLSHEFRFVDCRDLVPYLHSLGVGDLYSSPRFRPRRGSSHGYDVADPARVNSELGTEEEFDELCEKLRHYGMGVLLDVVPNHMAASHENPWWMDVLEHGPSSAYARYFDIDWHPAVTKAAFLQDDRVLLPVLGDFYGSALERGEFTLHLDETGFFLSYFDRRFPLDPRSYDPILGQCAQRLTADLGAHHPGIEELRQIRAHVWQIPPRTATTPEEIASRRELARQVKERLFTLYRDQLEVRLSMDAALREFSGTPGEPRSFEPLDHLHSEQGWRLAHWKIAFEEINYRRFFDINDLVCLRVEDAEVFEARHASIVQLVREGKVNGLRIDHIDGLHDPREYLSRLQTALCAATQRLPFFVVVEKILGRDEPLSAEWSVCGTTGYDFLNALNDVFLDPEGLRALEAVYARFTGDTSPFAEICYARNKQVMWKLFAGEVQALGHHLAKLAALDRHARDVPRSELVNALVEVTACLPVYRTYIRDFVVSGRDRHYLEQTLDLARRRAPENEVSSQAFCFLRRVLLLEPPDYGSDPKSEWLSFVMRWQKFTGPVMAKGLEDTANYAYHSLISRNEVGADPLREKPPYSVAELHAFLESRQRDWSCSLNATSTHDTKRSEDVRARINVLTEMPEEWEQRLAQWSAWNAKHTANAGGTRVPTAAEEVLIYQTLLGAWPLDLEEVPAFSGRLKEFLLKAVREAKTYSGWLHPNEAHEAALLAFVDAILAPSNENLFLPDLLAFVDKAAYHGSLNSLSQVLIKITAPGVPDLYQGTELWDFSLVDPDNRRPVDFRKRVALLEELRRRDMADRDALLQELVVHWQDGRIKLYLTDKALDYRRANAPIFVDGDYLPLEVTGPGRDGIIAFARRKDHCWAVTIAVRWTLRVSSRDALAPKDAVDKGAPSAETVVLLPASAPNVWRNVFTGETVLAPASESGERMLRVQEVLSRFPVALLARARTENAGS